MIRQGDILIVPVERLPNKLVEVPAEDGRVILAWGDLRDTARAWNLGGGDVA